MEPFIGIILLIAFMWFWLGKSWSEPAGGSSLSSEEKRNEKERQLLENEWNVIEGLSAFMKEQSFNVPLQKFVQFHFNDEREREIFKTLLNICSLPDTGLDLQHILTKSIISKYQRQEYFQQYDKIKAFSNKYGMRVLCGDAEIQKNIEELRTYLKYSNIDISIDDLIWLILYELKSVLAEKVKILFSEANTENRSWYVDVLVKHYSEELSVLYDCKMGLKNIKINIVSPGTYEPTFFRTIEGKTTIISEALFHAKLVSIILYLLEKMATIKADAPLIEELLNHHINIKMRKYESSLENNFKNIEDIDLMSGEEFEKFLEQLFGKMNYKVERTQLIGDQGCDLIVEKFGEKTVVQAKRSSSSIGNKAIQEAVGAIKHYDAQKGMVVTNNAFTSKAIELAESNDIELIDREKLEKWVVDHR